MPNIPFSKTLAAGVITNSQILEPRDGAVWSIRLSKNGQTLNPVVTIRKFPTLETILTVTLNADTSYYPRTLMQTNAGVDSTIPTNYLLGGFSIVLTVTGGDATGVVSGYLEWIS